MTIFYPDLSHFNNVNVEPDTVAVIAKASHGALFVDSAYSRFKAQAAAVGAVFGAYHWLNHGNVQAQARFCHNAVGDVPVMVDAEDTDRNDGYAGPLTVDDITGFVDALRALGGRCNLVYLPHWYWQGHMGSPDLGPLRARGIGLVSSNYTRYSDDGPGWAGYGGLDPVAWQYTDELDYGGGTADFNAFRGPIEAFRALLYGGSTMSVSDDRLLNGWPATVDQAGTEDNRGVGVHVADVWKFVWCGKGAYESGMGDPNGPANGLYLDNLLKLIRDLAIKAAQSASDAASSAKAAAVAQTTLTAPTQGQVNEAVLAALKDPGVQAGIAAAFAAHIKVA